VLDALVVMSALGCDLVLNLDGGASGRLDLSDGACRVQGVSEADPAINNQGDI